MGKPTRRRLVFADFSQVRADIEHLQACGYQQTGNWSLGQMCDHLAKSFDAMIDGYGYQAAWPLRLTTKLVMPIIFQLKRVPSGAKIPKRFEAADEISDEARVADFERALERIENYRSSFVAHPFAGRLSNRRWKQLQLIHCAHHLSFLVPCQQEFV